MVHHAPVDRTQAAQSNAGPGRAAGQRSARLPRDERRAQLLAAAQEVFVANGYHGAAMDEIAETAHVSKPVLYQHFPSKRELYLALLDSHLEALTELMLGAMSSTTDNKERVQAVMRAYFRFIDSDDQAHRLVFESDLINDADVSSRLETFNKTFAEAIARIIAEDTKLPLLEAQLLGRGLAGMAQVSARYWLETDGNLDLDVASDLIYRLAWRGISRFPKET
ncbi:TetR/AcrR family transcriptional regulator [Arthrobacter sp. UC242_113]|uniref:TetR/AcrR family transcriptional regulator n=1 Tax=Arthrobacter sp. UC242_113 TaxID=3374550 RepID=UPI003756637A